MPQLDILLLQSQSIAGFILLVGFLIFSQFFFPFMTFWIKFKQFHLLAFFKNVSDISDLYMPIIHISSKNSLMINFIKNHIKQSTNIIFFYPITL